MRPQHGATAHIAPGRNQPTMAMIDTTAYDGAALRGARDDLGLSLTDVRDLLRDRLPRHDVPSTSKLSRVERNLAPYAEAAHLIYALCAIYRLRVSEVSPIASSELERWSDLLASLERWIPILPGQTSISDLLDTAA